MQEETISLALLVVANAGNCCLLWGGRGLVQGFGFGSPTERCSKDLWSSAYSRPKDSSASGSSSRTERGSRVGLLSRADCRLRHAACFCLLAFASVLISTFLRVPSLPNFKIYILQPEAAIVKQNRSGLVNSSAPATRQLGDKTQP